MVETFKNSILAGVLIGLGCLISNLIANPIVGYCCFAMGLVYIRLSGLLLVTGQTQNLGKKLSFGRWCGILSGNIIGALIIAIAAAIYLSVAGKSDILSQVTLIAANKFRTTNLWQVLLSGTFCGMLMTIATYPKSPLYISILCVMAFLFAGFNHCVADAFYLGFEFNNLRAWIIYVGIILGNLFGGYIIKKEAA